MTSKYEAQIRHIESHYVRIPLNVKPEVAAAFKAACKANGTTPSTELKRFIDEYVNR